eukprot:11901372-Alexandrium_andersonii.AAC.1
MRVIPLSRCTRCRALKALRLRALCALGITIWRDLLRADQWKAATERPAAFALAALPRGEIVIVEDEWKGRMEKGRTVAICGFAK